MSIGKQCMMCTCLVLWAEGGLEVYNNWTHFTLDIDIASGKCLGSLNIVQHDLFKQATTGVHRAILLIWLVYMDARYLTLSMKTCMDIVEHCALYHWLL